MSFYPGQRWISDGESDQGLGTVTTVEGRFVTIMFTATGDIRKYAIENAPLTKHTLYINLNLKRFPWRSSFLKNLITDSMSPLKRNGKVSLLIQKSMF